MLLYHFIDPIEKDKRELFCLLAFLESDFLLSLLICFLLFCAAWSEAVIRADREIVLRTAPVGNE